MSSVGSVVRRRSVMMSAATANGWNAGTGTHRECFGHGPDLKIFVKDIADKHGRKRPLTVRSWATIKDLKDALQQQLHVPPANQRIYFGRHLTSGTGGELPNHWSLHDAGIYRSGETILVSVGPCDLDSDASLPVSASSEVSVASSLVDLTPKSLKASIEHARRGFAVGLKPELVLEGSGGTYFLRDGRKGKVAVFKPSDEEPYAVNNPRGYVQNGGAGAAGIRDSFCRGPVLAEIENDSSMSLRAGIKPGEACIREVAAYLLDHDGFSGVPETTLVEARHPAFNSNGSRLKVSEGGASIGPHSLSNPPSSSQPLPLKVGSFQSFVSAMCSMDDLGPSVLSVDEVHKIAILDIRILNADRNAANLLCRRKEDSGAYELVPIDHGFCLRNVADVGWFDWCWLNWSQLKKPLSPKSRDFVLGLDIDADVRLLQERLNIGSEALDFFRASSRLLQEGVRAGLTLYDIASMCCRNDAAGEFPSKLEQLRSMADELASAAVRNGRWDHVAASRALEEHLSPEKPQFEHVKGRCLKMHRSASSAMFTTTTRSLLSQHPTPSTGLGTPAPGILKSLLSQGSFSSTGSSNPKPPAPPPLALSSGSESGSDLGSNDVSPDTEECEEWAAAVVAGIDVGYPEPPEPSRRTRAPSISSSASGDDDSFSRSPGGFWHVAPGMAEPSKDVTWSPFVSPLMKPPPTMPSLSLAEPRIKQPKERSAAKFDVPPMVLLPRSGECDGLPPLSLSLSGEGPPPMFLLPPPMPLSSRQGQKTSFEDIGVAKTATFIPRTASGMRRIQSFAAMTFSSSSNQHISLSAVNDDSNHKNGLGEFDAVDDEQVRTYVLKFIDLLVTRETHSAHGKKAVEQ